MATYEPEEFVTKTGKTVVIRHPEPKDVDAYLAFQPQIAAETTYTLQTIGQKLEPTKIQEAWERSIKDPLAQRAAVFSGERMVAQIFFHPEYQPPHPWTKHVGYFGMFVHQEFWGEGIGRRLLEIIEKHALVNGITRIDARVRTKNERGVKLYTRMGYEIEGTRKDAALINGEMHDEYYIAKLLNQDSSWKPPVLKTERLLLRPIILDDAPAIFEYAKNPNVSQHTLWEPHKAIKDTQDFILDYAFSSYRRKVPEPFGIALSAAPDKIVGTIGCFWISKSAKSMELAYAIGEEHWGRGLVAEAAKAVVDYCFREFDLTRIQARCKTENKASARVMEKIGMKFEGTHRCEISSRGRHHDMYYYAVLKDEWK